VYTGVMKVETLLAHLHNKTSYHLQHRACNINLVAEIIRGFPTNYFIIFETFLD